MTVLRRIAILLALIWLERRKPGEWRSEWVLEEHEVLVANEVRVIIEMGPDKHIFVNNEVSTYAT